MTQSPNPALTKRPGVQAQMIELGQCPAEDSAVRTHRLVPGERIDVLDMLMLVLGIGYHVKFMLELRRLRAEMKRDGLVHGETTFPVSLTLVVAILLFEIGFFAIVSMVFGVGPFH